MDIDSHSDISANRTAQHVHESRSAMESASSGKPAPRILLMAVACSPYRGSEAGVGWNRALQAARFFDTSVITEEGEFADEIRGYLATHGAIPNLQFTFVPNGTLGAMLRKFKITYYFSYHLWHRRAYKVAANLHHKTPFHLTHQVTYCGYREPGFAWRIPVPFVWGPVGGTQNYPWQFLSCTDLLGKLKESTRSIVNSLQLRFSLGVRRAVKKATIFLAANESISDDFQRVVGTRPQVRLEIGTKAVRSELPSIRPRNRPLRLLWSGELRPHKALSLLIEAMAITNDTPIQLRVLGKGRCKKQWVRLAEKLGVADRIDWLGWLPHDQALAQFVWADLFVFTSLRDTTGTVVLEALANGVPVVCLNHQGVKDLVTDSCGVKIAPQSPRQVASELAKILKELEADPERQQVLREGALKRAAEFLWDRQGDHMLSLYQRALATTGSTPHSTSVETRIEG